MDLPTWLKDFGPITGVVITVWLFLKYSSPFTSGVIDALGDLRVVLVEVRDALRRFNGKE